MYSAEIIIFGIVLVLGILFVILAVFNVRNECKHDMNYRKYIDSIKIGDTFGHNLFKFSGTDDPFSENHGIEGFDPYFNKIPVATKLNNIFIYLFSFILSLLYHMGLSLSTPF